MSKRIGEYLVERGVLTSGQLTEALKAQLILGGHLGTCLIELGYIDERVLGSALSDLHGVPYADPDTLRRIPKKVIGALPGKLAERYTVVPLEHEPRTLRLAMANPADLQALDEIKFATGQKIETWVAPEVRIVEALENYYGVERRPRFVAICRELDRRLASAAAPRAAVVPQRVLASVAAGEGIPTAVSAAAPAATAAPEPEASGDPAPDEACCGYGRSWTEIADEQELGDRPESASRPAPVIGDPDEDLIAATMTLDEAAFLLCGADELKHVASTIMTWGSGIAARAILLAVKDGNASIWDAHGFELLGAGMSGLSWPVSSGWILDLLGGVEAFRGPLPASAAQKGFFSLLGIEAPLEAVVVPVHLNDRLVAILYLDGGTNGQVRESTDNIGRVGRMLSLALNLLILKKKLRSA